MQVARNSRAGFRCADPISCSRFRARVRTSPAQATRLQSSRSVIRLFSKRRPSAMTLLAPLSDQRAPHFFMRPQITDLQPPSLTPDPDWHALHGHSLAALAAVTADPPQRHFANTRQEGSPNPPAAPFHLPPALRADRNGKLRVHGPGARPAERIQGRKRITSQSSPQENV